MNQRRYGQLSQTTEVSIAHTIIYLLTIINISIVLFNGYQTNKSTLPINFPDLSHKNLQKQTYNVIATCYTASADETDDTPFITADGTDLRKVKYGVIAANWLPFGTIVEIDGKGYVVADRMNKRYGKYRIDILVKTKEEAFKCKQQKTLTVL